MKVSIFLKNQKYAFYEYISGISIDTFDKIFDTQL